MLDFDAMIATAISGRSISCDDALKILQADDAYLLDIVAAASKVRRHFFGTKVKLNYLVNLKSGMCPEDCHYCSQSLQSQAQIMKYSWLDRDEVAKAVEAGVSHGASTICLVSAGRGPSLREVDKVTQYIADIRAKYPQVKICACLGFIDDEKAQTLKESGVDRYNHNLNTARSAYEGICSTHSYDDRHDSVETARTQGLSACSGLIAGMGESDEQLVEVAYALRDLEVDSVPVNFLLPFEGTKLASHLELTPQRCLKILAMIRFVHPNVEVRSAAGREYHIRTLQPLVLEIANSIFLGDYLTSEGQEANLDAQMIADLGFEIEQGGQSGVCFGDVDCQKSEILMASLSSHEGRDPSQTKIDSAGIPLRQRGCGS